MLSFVSFLSLLLLQAGDSWFYSLWLIFAFLLLALYIGLYIIIYRMAAKRERSKLGWILFAIFFSPLLAIILLLIFGDSHAKVANDTADRVIEELRNDRRID